MLWLQLLKKMTDKFDGKLEQLESNYATKQDAYANKLKADYDLSRLSLEATQKNEEESKKLLAKLGIYGEEIKNLTNAVSVSEDGSDANVLSNIKIINPENGIIFSDGSKQTSSPRVIYTTDPRSDCPANAAAKTDLWKQTFTLENTATIVTFANAISNYTGRMDVQLHVDGNYKNSALTDKASVEWQDLHLHWGGTLPPGEHTISIRAGKPNSVGCGTTWGDIMTLIFEGS